ncbi:MAG: hypothetical protein AAB675_03215 [Patescibacteria group bacterium]
MNYISTTDLRTQSSQLVNSLKQGKKLSLVHRSRIIGEISPVKSNVKSFDVKKFLELKKLAKVQNAPKISYKERERIYRKHLMEKYGKGIS